jgi:hypothetical protein
MMRERQAEAQRQLEQKYLNREARLFHKPRWESFHQRIMRQIRSLLLALRNQHHRQRKKPSFTCGDSIVDSAQR